MGSELLHQKTLQGLQDVGGHCHWSIVLGDNGMWPLWHRNEAGHLSKHRDPLKTQARVEDMVKLSTLLGAQLLNALRLTPSWPTALLDSHQL